MAHISTDEQNAPLSSAQIDAYLARISLARPARADLEALTAIHRAHLLSFTWEALDAFMGWPSSIRPQDAFNKMIGRKRGGWCYEMNGLLGAALSALGFRVTRLCAGVNRELLGDIALGNHLTLRVDLDQPYLAEVGVADAIFEPIAVKVGAFRQRGFDFSIAETEDGWLRLHNQPHGLARSFDFQPTRCDEAAMLAAYHWLTESPTSPFKSTLALFRHSPDGYTALRNDRLREISADRIVEKRISDEAHFAEVLEGIFGLELPPSSEVWNKVLESIERSEAA